MAYLCLRLSFGLAAMITINVGWEWALGIFGLLLLIAWRGSARFTSLETSMQWVKQTLSELKMAIENGKQRIEPRHQRFSRSRRHHADKKTGSRAAG